MQGASGASKARRSLGDVRLLNQQRWESHVAAQQQREVEGAHTTAAAPVSPWGLKMMHGPGAVASLEVPTAGALFNRPNYYDYDEDDEDQRAQMDERGWNRDASVTKRGGNRVKLMPVYGSDAFATNEASVHKRRIPNTSVVNKIGDLRVPLCCWGMRLTAAQWSEF